MEIEINFFGPFRDAVGAKTLEREVSDGTTIEDVLLTLIGEFPGLEEPLLDDDGEFRDSINVTKNRENIRQLDGIDTEVGDDDVLRIAQPIHGGAV